MRVLRGIDRLLTPEGTGVARSALRAQLAQATHAAAVEGELPQGREVVEIADQVIGDLLATRQVCLRSPWK